MARPTRPKLATHYAGPRAGNRDCVALEGRCRVGDGAEEPIAVLDLDAGGCRVKGITAAVTKSDALQLWFGAVGPVGGRLRWVKRGSAGIAFDEPLGDSQIACAKETAAPAAQPQIIPLRRRLTGSD
jgi:hypothetical protein